MKLEKAIEIQTINNEHNPNITDPERQEANQLSIEAMRELIALRNVLKGLGKSLLPGEPFV